MAAITYVTLQHHSLVQPFPQPSPPEIPQEMQTHLEYCTTIYIVLQMAACERCELFTVEARETENGPFTVVSPIWRKLSQAIGELCLTLSHNVYMNAIFIHPHHLKYTSSLQSPILYNSNRQYATIHFRCRKI